MSNISSSYTLKYALALIVDKEAVNKNMKNKKYSIFYDLYTGITMNHILPIVVYLLYKAACLISIVMSLFTT